MRGWVLVIGERHDYAQATLRRRDLAATWWEQFERWFAVATATPAVGEANAMQLATADASGRPAVRTVLCRGIGADGLTFFTNLDSAKGHDLAANPYAAVVFSWLPLERQVRVSGPVTQVPRTETDAYVATRPPASVLGSWASPQSSVLADRAELDALVEAAEIAGVHGAPPFWGGYRLVPTSVEFWQGRPDRLHDRFRYRLTDAEAIGGAADTASRWVIERLAP